MDKNKALELALIEWIAKFKSSDKKTKDARFNFENLFQKWKDLDATFDDLYETLLPKAIKAHQPVPSVIRNSYKALNVKNYKTEKEFTEEWNDSIEATGQEVFFEYFPATTLDKDNEPKVYGNMSVTEYKAQRRYADQFPTLDTTELVKAWREQKQYNPDIDSKLENLLDGKDETDS